jgi:hypothetical protein
MIFCQKMIATYDHSISDPRMAPARLSHRAIHSRISARTVAALPLDVDGPASSVATKAG